MPRRQVESAEDAAEALDGPREPTVMEFHSDAPAPPPVDPAQAQRLESVGYGYHAERANQAAQEKAEPEPTVGRGLVTTDTVTKFDGRTEGMPLVFPAGTPVVNMPAWLGQEVVDTPGLTTEG